MESLMMNLRVFAFSGVMFAALLSLGCGGNPAPSPVAKTDGPQDHHEEEHAHPDEGPHDGHLIELGQEEYHAELVHDDASSTVTLYVLDSTARSAVAIEEETVKLNLVVDGKPAQ